ncbi:unnamed protein product [Periconia digitata]|uniref:AB hydrolase-1 domain-containing protein n=1 Tax=Periconia digitata TaxID=1303443 RepID=A0A9W4XQY7_9PLEO|nr:unnamed protein product [Periconia digitata]
MTSTRPVFLIIPGGSQNPTHYGYLAHLLQSAGYPTSSALLPSVGNGGKISIQDDTSFIRDRMILPFLELEGRDVILIMHSYGGVPGSAAALGLSKRERAAQGKKGGVVGQIFFTAMLQKGGDGTDVSTATGGSFPPFLKPDREANVIRCDNPIPVLYPEVPSILASTAAGSTLPQGLESFYTPVPRASWDSEFFKNRVAYIRTANDTTIPAFVQTMSIENAQGPEWVVKDIKSDHSPHLSHPEKFCEIILELAKGFESVD